MIDISQLGPNRNDEWRDVLRASVRTAPDNWDPALSLVLTPGPDRRPLFPDEPILDGWPLSRHIPAEAIRAILLDHSLDHDPEGIVINGLYIRGKLDLDHATLPCPLTIINSEFEAFPTFKYTIIPYLDLKESATPGIDLHYTTVKGHLRLDGMQMSDVIWALGLKVGGSLVLSNSCIATTGQNSKIREFHDHSGSPYCLIMQCANIAGTAFLDCIETPGSFDATGAGLRAGAVIDAHGTNNMPRYIDLTYNRIGRLTIRNRPTQFGTNTGTLNLSHATIGTLDIDVEKHDIGLLPRLYDVHGWQVRSVHGFLMHDKIQLARWLDTVTDGSPLMPTGHANKENDRPVYSAQPWKVVARLYDLAGYHAEANWLNYQAAKRAAGKLPKNAHSARWGSTNTPPLRWPQRMRLLSRRIFYGWTVGYGYRPAHSLFWFAALFGLSLALASSQAEEYVPTEHGVAAAAPTSRQEDELPLNICSPNDSPSAAPSGPTPANPTTEPVVERNQLFRVQYPEFNACLYAIDSTAPIPPTSQSEHWTPAHSGVATAFALIKISTWVLTALLAAGISNLLRKE